MKNKTLATTIALFFLIAFGVSTAEAVEPLTTALILAGSFAIVAVVVKMVKINDDNVVVIEDDRSGSSTD